MRRSATRRATACSDDGLRLVRRGVLIAAAGSSGGELPRGAAGGAAAPAPAVAVPPRRRRPASTLPAGYVIGPEDVLSIVFWRDKEMSADVVVRPDGKISLPLLNDVRRPADAGAAARRAR